MTTQRWFYGFGWVFIVLEILEMIVSRLLNEDAKLSRTHLLATAAVFLCLAIYEKIPERKP